MKLGWIDQHAHIMDESLLIEIDDVMQRAKENGIIRVMVIALSGEEMDLALRLKSKYEMIDVTCGFHPSDAHNISEKNWKKLEEILKTGEISAVGEIGLDYYWDDSHKEIQKEVFKRQIKLADKYKLPVAIHMRDATQDTYDIIEQCKPKQKGVMHCYTGSVEMGKRFIEQGFFISLAGPLTFKNAKSNLEVAKALPLDKLLIETDSPYLTPHPHRGKINEPSYVRFVGEKLAKVKNLEIDEVKLQLLNNYNKLYK